MQRPVSTCAVSQVSDAAGMGGSMDGSAQPDGIEGHHIHEARGSLLVRWPFSLAGLGTLLLLALLGLFGTDARLAATGNGVSLVVQGPVRIRNGNFYDTILTVETLRAVEDLIVRVDKEVWHEVTVNTVLPEPSEYGFGDGAYELRFGSFPAGKFLVVKISAQINSGRKPSTNAGKIAVADGSVVLAAVDYTMKVLP
jgi:hypothetical protein